MAVDRAFTGVHRIDLDPASWVEHIPGCLVGNDQLLADIFAAAGWEQRDRWIYNRRVPEPRLTAEYRDIADAPVPMLRTAAAALSRRYAAPYDGPVDKPVPGSPRQHWLARRPAHLEAR